MKKRFSSLLILFLLLVVKVCAQSDAYVGTWQIQSNATGSGSVQIQLQIFPPERNFLYPTQLKFTAPDFEAVYELLLVKKSMWHLAISKNKKRLTEPAYDLDDVLTEVNGGFEYSKDQKGLSTLTLKRKNSSKSPTGAGTAALTDAQRGQQTSIAELLRNPDLRFHKIDGKPPVFKTNSSARSLPDELVYFGLKDTILLPTRDGVFSVSGMKPVNRKSFADSISVMQNGQMIIDQFALDKKPHRDEILLDTGLNYLTFFADNFANGFPNKGRLELAFGELKYSLDFNDPSDSGASFIVGRFYCSREKFKENSFQQYVPPVAKPLLKNEKLIDRVIATSQQITLAIWDDATEDGDSISIMVEGKWLARGFPVKKHPQFLTVTLKPGPNNFVFVADNLGSIPPNTSVLEIIDGKKRKSYTMETILGEKNLVEIFYDLKPKS